MNGILDNFNFRKIIVEDKKKKKIYEKV